MRNYHQINYEVMTKRIMFVKPRMIPAQTFIDLSRKCFYVIVGYF